MREIYIYKKDKKDKKKTSYQLMKPEMFYQNCPFSGTNSVNDSCYFKGTINQNCRRYEDTWIYKGPYS